MRRIIVTEDAVDAGFDLKPLSNRGYEVVVTSDLSRLERSDEPASLKLAPFPKRNFRSARSRRKATLIAC
jgi:hypothetical protein